MQALFKRKKTHLQLFLTKYYLLIFLKTFYFLNFGKTLRQHKDQDPLGLCAAGSLSGLFLEKHLSQFFIRITFLYPNIFNFCFKDI